MTRTSPVVKALLLWTGFVLLPCDPLLSEDRVALPKPAFSDVSYGTHRLQAFDFWQAEGPVPRPLVIRYHGGGFRGGDKRSISPELLKKLLEQGVSVASVNYRLTDTGPYPMPMLDSARALQAIRHDAARYGIDPARIAATGGSAGAGISLWLAFHEDMADPTAQDPIARQSTRLRAAAVQGAQTTYDPREIGKLFNTSRVHEALIALFGMEDERDLRDPAKILLFEDSSPIMHLSRDDPPVLLVYRQKNEPLPPNSTGKEHIHHPRLGFHLKERMDRMGMECMVLLSEDYERGRPGGPMMDQVRFLVEKLRTS